MELEGQVVEIIYQNEVNSYTIAVLESENEDITIVGYLPFISIGDSLKVYGKYVEHPDYGTQFKVDTFEKIMPKTLGALEKYLSGGIIKGIGPTTAKKIVDTFGEETIAIFKYEPEKLARIRGISKNKAIEIATEFNEKWEMWQIVGFLERFGISAANSQKVYKQLGVNAIEEIEQNPYILLDITYGVDFKQIDKMAMELGISEDFGKRIESAIKYSLVTASYNGNTCVIKENLIQFVKALINTELENIEDSIINLKGKEEIVVEKREESEWVYLYPFYKAEKNIAEKLITLKSSKNIKKIEQLKQKLKIQERISKIELSDKQKEAIEQVNENNVCVITGGPGTGKTTIIKFIIEIYKAQKMKVVLCAPTGRAAKRMTETTGEEAKTIHRLLEIGKLEEEKNFVNVDYNISPIDADVIIIDEMSMVDVFLMNYILKGVYLGTKLILVGDSNQLPSVGPGNILDDIINSEKVPTVALNKIFRQAAQSKIVLNAHNVNNGRSFVKREEMDIEEWKQLKNDFFYINEVNQEKVQYNIISLCKDRLKKYGDYDFFSDIQVLTPTKKGALGTRELNKILQQALNPEKDNPRQKQVGDRIFRKGDRVMQIKNNYDIMWEKKEAETKIGTGIFNGEFGIISNINEEEKQIKVIFDDEKIAWYSFSDLDQLEHAYAITIHKSQGSEFDVVLIVLPQSAPMLLTRNLLYTGITRAKKMLIVIGSNKVVEFMIKNTDSKRRNTGLMYKLIE